MSDAVVTPASSKPVSGKGGLARWLISGPPLLYLIFFFAVPTLIMVFASFRFPGDYGGLAPLFDAGGALNLTLENFEPFFTSFIYLGFPEVVFICNRDDAGLSGDGISGRAADCAQPAKMAQPADLAGDPAVLE